MKKIYRTEIIEKYLKENKISKAEFCRRCGISNTVLKNIYMQNGQIYLRGYAKVCDLLGIKLKDLIY